jgi:hypothetical protein
LSAEFNHPLSYERPFKFPRHLIGPLEIDNIIAISAINIHSAIFKIETARKRKRKLTIHGHGHGHGHRHGHGIGEHLLSISYGAIVPIAPYGMPLK